MTGPEHYRLAENYARTAQPTRTGDVLMVGIIHALLALADAVIETGPRDVASHYRRGAASVGLARPLNG